MKRVIRLLARLYPAPWRARYGAEFDQLVDDSKTTVRDATNVLTGAITMQFTRWGYWRLGTAGMLLGIAVSAAIAFSLPMWFRAEAEMAGPSDPATLEAIERTEHELVSTKSLVQLMQIHGLYSDELRKQPLERMVGKMRRGIVFGRKDPGLVTIRFEYPDHVKAAYVVSALEAGLLFGAHLREIDAEFPSDPYYPNRAFIVLGGLFAGMAGGFSIAHLLRTHQHLATCPTCGHRCATQVLNTA